MCLLQETIRILKSLVLGKFINGITYGVALTRIGQHVDLLALHLG